jgi:biopolymer transport protein ExbD
MKFIEENESDIDNQGINIVPMIDVIFAILTFFIIASLDLIRIDNIPVNLPSAMTSDKVEKEPFILTIDNENNVFIGNKLINSANIIDPINEIISGTSNNILVISADKDVSYGKVVEVLDQIRSIANLRIGISTEK